MRELSETEGILLDRLDELENRLLAFERALVNNGDWRTLVHGLFRDTHNLKSAFAMAGYDVLGRLAHGLESLLDRYRSGKAIPDAVSTNRMLEATDFARSALSLGSDTMEDDSESVQEVLGNLERAGHTDIEELTTAGANQEQPSLEIAFPLDSSEMGKLKAAVSEHMRPYILEKLVDSTLAEELVSGLPVFDAVNEAGSCIAWRLKKDASGGAVLSILFASATSRDELSYILFDPFYPVDTAAKLIQPETQLTKTLIPRILIVDDDSVAIMILQHYLALYGRVDTALSGQEAIDKFRIALGTDPYNVIFLDIMMPGIDGQTVLRALRGMEDEAGGLVGEGCKVVMASAISDFTAISTSFRDLCDAYIVKPFDRDAVSGAIAKFGFSPIHIDASRVLPRP
jgi:two-component system chemotaxis response regulator CheY